MKSESISLQYHIGQRLSRSIRYLSIGIIFCLSLCPASSDARPVRVATYNIENGVGDIGSAEYNAVQSILARIDADVVCFQELQTTSFAAWSNMASVLGYPYAVIGWDGGSLAGSLYMGYFSRFPIQSTYNVESPPGAKELSRYPFRAVIDIPDAELPLVIWNMHHKSGATSIDKFRRAIEAYRITQNIDAYLAANSWNVEYLFVGDMNDDIRDNQTAQFTNQPAGAPGEYVLGSDIVFPVRYSKFPTDRYIDAGLGLMHMPAYWESTTTPITRVASGRELDYVFLSPALANSPMGAPQSELYYSAMDFGEGLPKWGDPLPAGTSATASDHLPVFVDIQMADLSSVEPVASFISSGEAGGPFSPVSMFYTVYETNPVSSTWSISADVDWLTVLPDSFTLAPYTTQEVEVFLNALVESLPPGVYTASVTFWNETEDISKIRQVTLTIRDPLGVQPMDGLTATGYSGGPFSPESKVYGITNKSSQSITFTATSSAPWLSVSPSSWLLQAGGSVDVTAVVNAQANSLPVGTHFASVIFSNQVSGLIQARPVVLTIVGTLCDAVDRCDLEWTTGGDAAWFYQAEVTEDGTDAAQSGPISSSQQTWLETTVTGPVQVAYSWRVSSQTNSHLLRFLDNGIAHAQISGETEWVRKVHEINSGVHTLRWAYATTTAAPQGNNAGWVDRIAIDHLTVVAAEDWMASGMTGGPFSPPTHIYTLTNSGSSAISWSAESDENWFGISSASGELAPYSSATVECSMNSNADALPFGTYSGSIIFSNQTSGFSLERPVLLSAMGPLCDAVERCDLVWTTGGSSEWFLQTNNTSDGIDAAQSGPITTNQETWLETTVAGPVQLSFKWRVSSGVSHPLRFLIDGISADSVFGSPAWTSKTFAIGSGTHTLRWVFTNNTAAPVGSNAGWLDKVTLDFLTASPTATWYPAGPYGGPFDPATQEYVLTNSGPSSIQWIASTKTNWISITPDSGMLEPGSSAIVEFSLKAQATAEKPGTHPASVVFSNQTTGLSLTRPVTLLVQDYLIIRPDAATNMGYVGGPYSPETRVYTISNSAPTTVSWSVAVTNWLTPVPSSGIIAPGTTSNVVVNINTNANALPAGLKSTRVYFTDTTTMHSQPCWLYLNVEEALAVSCIGGAPAGPVGGPFVPAETAFILTNRSRVAQNWTAFVSTNWLALDSTGGTLGPNSGIRIIATRSSNTLSFPMGVYPATVLFSNQTGRTTSTQSMYLSIGYVFCEAAEACDLDWSFGGNSTWLYQTNVTKDGVDAAACGAITNSQESWMQISVIGSGTFSYWWKLSSTVGRDWFEIWVDGTRLVITTGSSDWQKGTNVFETGNHTIRWRFYKNTSGTNVASGGAYVDLISWLPDRTAMGVPVEWYQRFGLAPGTSGNWNDLDPRPSAAGTPNWFQYVAGLSPTDPADSFQIHAIQQSAGQPTRIQWWGGTNGPATPYVIQSATNLEFGPWNPTGAIQRAAGLNIWTNAEPADIKRYYRILAQPDP